MKWLRAGVAVIIFGLVVFFVAHPTHAEDILTTIGVGDTILEVSGKTSPNAFVTISRDGSVIGTTIANNQGIFSQNFAAQTPGLHELSIYAQTTGGENTDTITATVNITEHATTPVNYFLPPTLMLAHTTIEYGRPLELRGETTPSGVVTIYIDNSTYTTATANMLGEWSAQISTTGFLPGQHDVFVRATDTLGAQSYPTTPRHFTTKPNPTSLPIIPPILLPIAPPVPIITFPSTGTIWSEPTITIEGRARPNVQVEIWDHGRIVASVWSDGGGYWSINLRLEPIEYILRARACIENVCSGFSNEVRFTYKPSGAYLPLDRPLKITADRYSFTIDQCELLTIDARVEGGQPPYQTIMHWEQQTNPASNFLNNYLRFTHSYQQAGRYNLLLEVKDSQGRTGHASFSVNVKPQPSSPWLFIILCLILLILLLSFLLLQLVINRRRACRKDAKEQKRRGYEA